MQLVIADSNKNYAKGFMIDFSVHPNPATDIVHISSSEIVVTKVEIVNLNGQLVLSTKTILKV